MVFAYFDEADSEMKLFTTSEISTDIHPSTLWSLLRLEFFWGKRRLSYYGNFRKTSYDAQDIVTTDKTKIVKTVYSFKCDRLHNLVAFTQISLTEKKTDASITFTIPQ
jgi:hypothetical protein